MTPTDFLQLLNFGALALFSYLMAKGQLIPKQTVDKMSEETRAHTELLAKNITEKISDTIEKSVKRGFVDAFHEVNGEGKSVAGD